MIKKNYITFPIDNIIPYENNNKIHTEKDVKEIVKSIEKNSDLAPMIIDENNIVIVGHGRLEAFKKLGYTEVELLQVTGLTETQKKDYRIRDNTTNLLSEFDLEAIRKEILELWEDSYDMISHLDGLDELNFFEDEEYREEIEDEVPVVEKEDVIIQRGDIFQLWDHILMCWDSTSEEDIKKLMEWEKADMIFTDPPYNVNYKGQGEKTSRGIENDHMSDANFKNFLRDVFKRYSEITKEKAGVYVFHSSSTQAVFQEALEANNFQIKNQLIWNKPSAALGWWDYRWKHEPFFYCGLNGTKNNFYGDRTHGTVIDSLHGKTDEEILKKIKRARKAESEWKGTVWSMKRDSVAWYVHPTQKPIGLIEYALKNSSKPWNIVVDLFGGSGSTMVACEKKWRVCYTMELDPHFVQVIIKRYYEVTNGKKEIECLNRDLDFSFLEK